jgi:hypothetical protein
MRRRKRRKLNSRGSAFWASKILGVPERTRYVVLFQVSAVDGIPKTLVSYAHGTNRDFMSFHLDSATRVLQKSSVPTVWLHAPGSDEGAVFQYDNPDADEAVLAGTGPNAQTFALPENSQDVMGKLSLRFQHSRTFLPADCSEREHASFGSPSHQAHR